MPEKYFVELTSSECRRLKALVEQGRGSVRHQRRMQALLLAADGFGDEEIAGPCYGTNQDQLVLPHLESPDKTEAPLPINI